MTLAPVTLEAPLLDVRGLTIRLANGGTIVSDIDLAIAPGEITGGWSASPDRARRPSPTRCSAMSAAARR